MDGIEIHLLPTERRLVLSVTMEDKLLELAADEGLKISFETSTFASFWKK